MRDFEQNTLENEDVDVVFLTRATELALLNEYNMVVEMIKRNYIGK